MAKTRVWAVLTVSSEQQAETIPQQREWAQKAAAANGWHLARVLDGVASGKDGPRRIIGELLRDLAQLEPADRPRYVLMVRLDRVGRGRIVDSQVVLHKLRELGVSVWTRDQGEVKNDGPMDELMSAVQFAQAAQENAVRSDRARAAWKNRLAKGIKGTQRPYGIKRGPDGRDVVDKERAKVVRTAFKMRLAGSGYHVIGLKLAAIAPPQRFRNGKDRVVRWTQNRVKRMLENRNYVGPVIDEATYVKAQDVTKRLTTADRSGDTRRKYPWPLSGAIKCYCGKSMVGMANGSENRYYCCRASWVHGTACRLVRADVMEAQFQAILERLKASPRLIATYQRRNLSASPALLERSLKEAQAQLADLNRKREAAWELHVSGKVRAEDVQERLDRLAAKRDEVDQRISAIGEQLALARAAVKSDADAEELVRKAPAMFEQGTEDQQRRIARAVSVAVGGLCVEEDGTLTIRRVDVPDRQRRKSA